MLTPETLAICEALLVREEWRLFRDGESERLEAIRDATDDVSREILERKKS